MAVDMSKWDLTSLSDDQKQYIRNTGNPDLMRRAGLAADVDFNLSNVPGSMEEHEKDGSLMPEFDKDGKIAEESVGNPDDPLDRTLQPPPAGTVPNTDTVPFEGSDAEKSGKAKVPPPPPAKKVAAAPKAPTS